MSEVSNGPSEQQRPQSIGSVFSGLRESRKPAPAPEATARARPPEAPPSSRSRFPDRDYLLPSVLQDPLSRRDKELQAEIDEKFKAETNLSPEERRQRAQEELDKGRSLARALSYEWVQMQRFLPRATLEYIASPHRSARSIEQLLEMRIFSSVNLDRVDNLQETAKRHIETVNKWMEMQKVMDADQSGMRTRVEKLEAEHIQGLLNGVLPVENLLDQRDDKKQRPLLEKGDIERLLPVVLSRVEMRRVEVMGAKFEQYIEELRQSSHKKDGELAARMRGVLDNMDPGVYYNMLLGRIPPYELRINNPAEATGVTWELVRMAYVTKEDMRSILKGPEFSRERQQWEASNARWETMIEQQKPALEQQWQAMMDHFYRERPKTYERLVLLPEEMRYHLLSINLSPDHQIFTLKEHLKQVIEMLHSDDLYPFLQYRAKASEATGGANASWLRFLEIVHKLHENLETGKTQCIGCDFFTGLPLYPPRRYSFVVLGIPGGGKTDNFVFVNLIQHQSSKEALIVIDPKGDSTSFVKEYLGKRNLGELTGMAAGALSKDHRVMIVGPGEDEGSVNILWYIPTTKEAEARVRKLENLIARIDQGGQSERLAKLRGRLETELADAREDLTALERKQQQMAVKVGAAWAKASIKQEELERMSHTAPGIRNLYYETISAAMLHLRLTSPGLPPLMALRFVADPEQIEQLASSPSQYVRDTYASIKNLGPEERNVLQALLVDSMSKLNDPLVQQFTSTNSVDVEALLRPEEGKPPWVVCVNMHLNLNTYQLLTPAFESAFEVWHEAIKYAKVHSPDVHSNDIFIVMDEAKNIAVNSSSGKVHPNITEIVDVMRSHGERGLFSTQSPDPRVLDPELLGKVTLLVGTPDDDTAKYVAEKAGITTRDLSTSSRTRQSMISGESGVEVLDIGWGSTGTRSSQWRDIIELTWGSTAREVPLIYPHNLTQMPRDLGIMIVPGFAPALYVPLNPRTSIVLQAMRRLEPVVEKGPIVDSHTPRDMAVQLAAPQPPDTHVAVGQASLSYSDDSAQELEELQGERQFLEEEEQGVAQPEEAAVLDQLAKEVAAAIEMQRQYKEAEEDTAQESGRPPAGR